MYPPGKDRTHGTHLNGSRAGLTHSSTPLIPKCRFKGEVCRICDRFHGGYIHPQKLTWNPKMEVWKMIFLFKQVIFRFHVSFRGCNFPYQPGLTRSFNGPGWKIQQSRAVLVGGFNHPSEKYDRQNGNLPQIGVKIRNSWNHHLRVLMGFVVFRVDSIL